MAYLGKLEENADTRLATVTGIDATFATGMILTINAVPTAAGTGYAVNDVLTVTGGTATVKVTSISGGGGTGPVTGLELIDGKKTGYTVSAGNATTGAGNNDCTVEITSVVEPTALYTVPVGKTAVYTKVVGRCTTADTVTGKPIASVGSNTPNYDDLNQSFNVLDTDAVGYTIEEPQIAAPEYAAASVLYLNITTESTATSQVFAIDVFGYLIG